jgi:hypothetical protein
MPLMRQHKERAFALSLALVKIVVAIFTRHHNAQLTDSYGKVKNS